MLDGQHQLAFSSLIGLLREWPLYPALPADQHGRIFLHLRDLCSPADVETARQLCVDLAFAALRRRHVQPSGEVWLVRAQTLMNLYCMADGRLKTPWPVRRRPEAQRAGLLQDAAAAIAQHLQAAGGAVAADQLQMSTLRQGLLVHACQIQAP